MRLHDTAELVYMTGLYLVSAESIIPYSRGYYLIQDHPKNELRCVWQAGHLDLIRSSKRVLGSFLGASRR